MAEVLLIEPNMVMRHSLQWLLRSAGHTVMATPDSGQGALTGLDRWTPQAVVLDIALPDVNGYDLLRAVREAYPEARIVIATGWSGREILLRCRRWGADVFLAKPIHPGRFLEALAGLPTEERATA